MIPVLTFFYASPIVVFLSKCLVWVVPGRNMQRGTSTASLLGMTNNVTACGTCWVVPVNICARIPHWPCTHEQRVRAGSITCKPDVDAMAFEDTGLDRLRKFRSAITGILGKRRRRAWHDLTQYWSHNGHTTGRPLAADATRTTTCNTVMTSWFGHTAMVCGHIIAICPGTLTPSFLYVKGMQYLYM